MKAKNPSTGNFEEVYVKALDSLPVGSEIDFIGSVSDIPVGWEQVDDVPIYSTTEKVVGTWIDGKPLYRKVVNYSGTISSGSSTIPHGISNIGDYRIVRDAVFIGNNLYYQNGAWLDSTSFCNISSVSADNLGTYIGSNWAGAFTKIIATVEYTKTTD